SRSTPCLSYGNRRDPYQGFQALTYLNWALPRVLGWSFPKVLKDPCQSSFSRRHTPVPPCEKPIRHHQGRDGVSSISNETLHGFRRVKRAAHHPEQFADLAKMNASPSVLDQSSVGSSRGCE